MPAKGSANNNPTPGTLQLSQKVDKNKVEDTEQNNKDGGPKGILKGINTGLSEEEQLRRNTENNRSSNKNVGYVASTISSETNKVRIGSAYGLTTVDRKGQIAEEDLEIMELLNRAEKLVQEQQRHKRPTGITVTVPPSKLRTKRQARFKNDPERDETLDKIQYALQGSPAIKKQDSKEDKDMLEQDRLRRKL